MKRKAQAHWEGNATEGRGQLTTPSGVLDKTAYSFKSRFKDEDGKAGTNPEELIAAAHAGCFSMALSLEIANAGYTADAIDTSATVSLDEVEGGFEISAIKLQLVGKVSGLSKDEFTKLAQGAKEGCPVSKALKATPIELDIQYNS